MFYIKLDESMDLVITVREPLFRGENLNRKIVYLLPLKVGTINVETACLYLNYVRADGVADIVSLERMEEKYNESYLQYTLPIDCKLTRYPGEVCTWIQIYTGNPSNPSIQKTGECILQIQESKNMDDYLSDQQVTAIYQLQRKINGGCEDTSCDSCDGCDNPDWEDMDEPSESIEEVAPASTSVRMSAPAAEESEITWDSM